MIPKIIHYCWFGDALPDEALKCIDSWKKYCPDYEIVKWDESNFDVNCCKYVKEAYENKKWAFVSDYARFKILYDNGGVYFDTDVKLIKPIDDILDRGPFMGLENDLLGTNGPKRNSIAPGLGMGAVKGMMFYKEILNDYKEDSFIKEDGSINTRTVVERITEKMLNNSNIYLDGSSVTLINGVYIYPVDYFCPLSYELGMLKISDNTRSIHLFDGSWVADDEKNYMNDVRCYTKIYSRFVPLNLANKIARIYSTYKMCGMKGIYKKIKNKLN